MSKRILLAICMLLVAVTACAGAPQGGNYPTPSVPTVATTPAPVVQTVIVTTTPASTQPAPTGTPVPTRAPASPTGTLDRHGCPDQADHFMNQVEYTVDQPSGKIDSPAGTNAGFIWGPDLTINGQRFGRKAVILTGPGSITVSGTYRVRWHQLIKSTLDEYQTWATCFVHKDEGVTYDWVRFTPTQTFGLDRHGCPDQADHFMNQVEYTVDQPSGKIDSPAGTNAGFIWGPDLTINGQRFGRKAVILTGPGSITVSGTYRVRWHQLIKSTLDEYQTWATCFVHKDEGVTYDWVRFTPN